MEKVWVAITVVFCAVVIVLGIGLAFDLGMNNARYPCSGTGNWYLSIEDCQECHSFEVKPDGRTIRPAD